MFQRREKEDLSARLRRWVWPRTGFVRAWTYLFRRMGRLEASPHAVALGFAAGVFASFTPFVGFHFMLAFLIAWVIGGNLLASAFGTFVGNPLTFPFIWLGTYDLGRFILGGTPRSAENDIVLPYDMLVNYAFDTIAPIFMPMLIGGVLLGVLGSLVGYWLVRRVVAAYQHSRRTKIGRGGAPVRHRVALSRRENRAPAGSESRSKTA